MRHDIAQAVLAVVSDTWAVWLDKAKDPARDLNAVQARLLAKLRPLLDGLSGREPREGQAPLNGDKDKVGAGLGVYFLVSWIDDIFSLTASEPWTVAWQEATLERSLFENRDRFEGFWQQLDHAETETDITPLYIALICIALGFRGKFRTMPERQLQARMARLWAALQQKEEANRVMDDKLAAVKGGDPTEDFPPPPPQRGYQRLMHRAFSAPPKAVSPQEMALRRGFSYVRQNHVETTTAPAFLWIAESTSCLQRLAQAIYKADENQIVFAPRSSPGLLLIASHRELNVLYSPEQGQDAITPGEDDERPAQESPFPGDKRTMLHPFLQGSRENGPPAGADELSRPGAEATAMEMAVMNSPGRPVSIFTPLSRPSPATPVKRHPARPVRLLGRTLARLRRPSPPINGLVLVVDWHSLTGTGKENARLLESYLSAALEGIQIQCPVFLVVEGLETIQGFGDFFRGLSPQERRSRWGIHFPWLPEPDEQEAQQIVGGSIDDFFSSLCRRVYEQLCRQPPGKHDEDAALRKNAQLVELLAELTAKCAALRSCCARIVKTLLTRWDNWLLFGGCYFLLGGCDSQHRPVTAGLLDKIRESRHLVAWTPKAIQQDAARHSWASFCNGLVAVLTVLIFMSLGWLFWN